MSTTFYPTQIGYVPTGNASGPLISSVTIGRTITGSFDGIGFGKQGRPDYLQDMIINLANRATDGTLTQKGTITLNVGDLIAAKVTNPNVPTNLNLTLREVSVCDSGVTKKMIILGSQPYSA